MEWIGQAVSKGVAVGPAYLYQPVEEVAEGAIKPMEVERALQEYDTAIIGVKSDLATLVEELRQSAAEEAKIFEAHIDILEDEEIIAEVKQAVRDELIFVSFAVHRIMTSYAALLAASNNDLLRERAADLNDVRRRLIWKLSGREARGLDALLAPVVVVAHNLLPSDTAGMDRKNVLAIVTETGGPTSHSAILARQFEIPCVTGIENATSLIQNGQLVAVDGQHGRVEATPDEGRQRTYASMREEWLTARQAEQAYRDRKAMTPDGYEIEIELNIGSASAEELAFQPCVDGVGLFRTEFLYMGRPFFPSEEEQYAVYRRVLEAFGEKPVILRTLDVGGDKQLDCLDLPKEDNPFLGNRALRLCLARPELFRAQLRAALRAATHGNLWVMFPMVGGVEDFIAAKQALLEARQGLEAEGISIGDVKVGTMIEIPSVALVADKLAAVADFASIGSNDLCQYLCAADRMNSATAGYYRRFHPGLFRLIRFVAEAFAKADKPLGVCGELAGDPLSALALVGCGVTRLSMGSAGIGAVKRMVCGIPIQEAQGCAEAICECDTEEEVKALLEAILASIKS